MDKYLPSSRNAITLDTVDIERRGDDLIITHHRNGSQGFVTIGAGEAAMMDQWAVAKLAYDRAQEHIDCARAIAEALRVEREACAAICDEAIAQIIAGALAGKSSIGMAALLAAAIRARKP